VAATIINFSRISTGNNIAALIQDVNNAADLVTNVGDYESELVTVDATIVSSFSDAGAEHIAAQIETNAISGEPDLMFRIPQVLNQTLRLTPGCTITVTGTPFWRYNNVAEISAWHAADVTIRTCCGDGTTDPGEQCDDNNLEPFDGCSPTCQNDAQHLLITEVAITSTDAEFIEIYNPSSSPVDLTNVYLADYNTYYEIATSTNPSSSDFWAQFPSGTQIPAGGFMVVATQGASEFYSVHGVLPDFDMDTSDASAPDMLGDYTGSTSLTNTGEMLVLFRYTGGDLVADYDYFLWGNTTHAMDKSGITVGSGTYLGETADASQIPITPSHGYGESYQRCDSAESTETKAGSNGITGHDETSEDFSAAFLLMTQPTPGGPPPANACMP
jgi:cysteine-rich repeat protein